MKKIFAFVLSALLLVITGCGNSNNSNSVTESVDTDTTEVVSTTTETETDGGKTEESVKEQIPDKLSDKYADLDNRSFKYNGKIMTFGVSTLQDFLDAGAELDPVTGKGETNYDIHYPYKFIGIYPYDCVEYHLNIEEGSEECKMQICFMNPTGEDIAIRDCVLGRIDFNFMGCEKLPSCLEFSFDKAVTIEEMIENSGEPTYKDDDEVSFTEVSKTFNTQESGYSFVIQNSQIQRMRIDWLP